MEDIRDLYTKGLTYEVALEFDGLKPTKWDKMSITDAHEALRVKIIEMLGSEGPAMEKQSSTDCLSLKAKLIQFFTNWR